jgi:hypothetical protein
MVVSPVPDKTELEPLFVELATAAPPAPTVIVYVVSVDKVAVDV